MAKYKTHIIPFFLFLTIVMNACRDPFEPELSALDQALLVVEGYVEINGGESEITLSRTTPISENQDLQLETGASVFLQDNNSNQWLFEEREDGKYVYSGFFSPNGIYFLGITLRNGEMYFSDSLKPVLTPEIDEVGFIKKEDGVEIFISTSGNQDAQYFLWDYQEHWIFRPGVMTSYIYNPGSGDVTWRRPEERINLCWNSNLFPHITLENSGRYGNNFVFQKALVKIPNRSEKLMQRYSIKVRQKAIDKAAFDFWEILRKNSDDIGGIFSPLPSLIRGNIHHVANRDEQVIGFVSMGVSTEKRIYIDNSEVAPWVSFIPEYEFCHVETDTTFISQYEFKFGSGALIPARPVVLGTTTIGYQAVTRICADCTLRGTNIQPAFWEDQ